MEEAEHHHRAALAIAEELTLRHPGNADYRFLLAQTHSCLSQRLLSRGRVEEADSENVRAVAILEKLHAEFPSIDQYKAELAEAYALFVVTARPHSATVAARARLEKARQLADELVEQVSPAKDYSALAACLYVRGGALAAWTGDHMAAIENYRRAIASSEALSDRYPSVPSFLNTQLALRQILGGCLRNTGQLEQARIEFEKAAAGLESLLQRKPGVSSNVDTNLRRAYQSLKRTLDDLGDHRAAAAVRQKTRRHPECRVGSRQP